MNSENLYNLISNGGKDEHGQNQNTEQKKHELIFNDWLAVRPEKKIGCPDTQLMAKCWLYEQCLFVLWFLFTIPADLAMFMMSSSQELFCLADQIIIKR